MPCSKGMRRCKAGCLHRRLVDDYFLARHAQLLAEEAATVGDPEDIRIRREENYIVPITFKQWLQGHGREEE